MAVLTVRAEDSAAAMDEVIRRLGPDALILSTRARDGQVEIVATDEAAAPVPLARPAGPRRVSDVVSDVAPDVAPVVARVVAPGPVAHPDPRPDDAPGWTAGFAAHLARAIGMPEPGDAPEHAPAPASLSRPAPQTSPTVPAPNAHGATDVAAVLAAPRIVLVGPVGAGKSGLAFQIAAARLDAAEALGQDSAVPGFIFCGTGSQSDGAYLSQKAWLLGADMGFAAAETMGLPDPAGAQIVVLSDLHPDPVAAVAALGGDDAALVLLVLPAGLRADRATALAARWQGLARGVVLTLSPGEEVTAEDVTPLKASGLAPVWTSRRGKMIGGLTAMGGSLAEPVWISRRARLAGDDAPQTRHPETLTPAAG